MAVTNYISMDGMLIGEMTNGVMRNYGTDALGSVVETVLNGVEENTYQYKPYGGLLAKTGVAADPSYLWNGGSGYRATSLRNSSSYVARRHFTDITGTWTTVDPLWPVEPPFGYSAGNPVTYTDPSGLGLGCKTISFTHSDNCPSAQVDWGVQLMPTYPVPGLVIQHVTISIQNVDCNNKVIGKPVTSDYFEAWVLATEKGKGLTCVGNCIDHWSTKQRVSCANAVITWNAEACFIPGATLKDSTWEQPCTSFYAAGLPCRALAPNGWSGRDTSQCVSRTLSYSMQCCNKCGKTRRTTDAVAIVVKGCGY